MRNLLNPRWIFIINTLPVSVLFLLYFGQFSIINTLLDEENIHLWKTFGWGLAALSVVNLGYSVYLIYRKKELSLLYGIISLLSYIPFIYLFIYYSDKVIPRSVPQWMISGNIIIYVGTFLMPTLAYSLFVLVVHFTSKANEHKAWKNFLMALTIPILWYFFVQVILPLWKPVDSNFDTHVLLVFLIIGTLVFLFFLVRGVFILVTKKSTFFIRYQLMWKIPISIVLPFVGLAVNNGQMFDQFVPSETGILGNFNGFWFYAIAVLNGLLLCLPNFENKMYRFILFIGRSITFTYTLYFFLVFLPFLPLSVLAIIAVGIGFLMLTPLVLFVIHGNQLSSDFSYLKKYFSNRIIWLALLVGVVTIPLLITGSYLQDKSVLEETLQYIYSPDYSKDYEINKISLQKTLNIVKLNKDDFGGGIFGTQTPYLSSYFNWLVLDNLTLSDSKINKIERIFFKETSFNLRLDNIRNDEVEITNISTTSRYDNNQKAWVSWIDLEITNRSDESRFKEYATTIDLPTGTWISDYYLYVGDRKEMGVLAEKKSAMWVFTQIRNENRDPGILYYLTGNKVAFRVFPFAKEEVRKTGIELLHKEPIKLTIDGNRIELGSEEVVSPVDINPVTKTSNVFFVSGEKKQQLNKVNRKPYFHFLVDVSESSKSFLPEAISRMEKALSENEILAQNAKISFVNSYTKTENLSDNWQQDLQLQNLDGGFYLDRAIRKTLAKSYKEKSEYYPVIVVVTNNLQDAILGRGFLDFQFAFPESDLFFELRHHGVLEPHSLVSKPLEAMADTVPYSFENPVLEYLDGDNVKYYLPNNEEASVFIKADVFEVNEDDIKEKNWESALQLQGMWASHVLHPYVGKKEWLRLVKYSFISRVMSPVTSYLVVENEAQKAALLKKQEQVLSGNKSLDTGEDAQRMSEPSMIIVMVLLGLALLYLQRRKNRVYR